MGTMTIVPCKSIEDWYAIEKLEHDNKGWFVETRPDCSVYMYSGRISDADIEGSAEEMRDIAKAIKDRGFVSHKRCAVQFREGQFYLCSPRNSTREGVITVAEADDLADRIIALLGNPAALESEASDAY